MINLKPNEAIILEDGNMLVQFPNDTSTEKYLLNGSKPTTRIIISKDDIITKYQVELPKVIYVNNRNNDILTHSEYRDLERSFAEEFSSGYDDYEDSYTFSNLEQEYAFKKAMLHLSKEWIKSTTNRKETSPIPIEIEWNIVGYAIDTGCSFIHSEIKARPANRGFFSVDIARARDAMFNHYKNMDEYKTQNFDNGNDKDRRFAKIEGNYLDTTDYKILYFDDLDEAKKSLKEFLEKYELVILKNLINIQNNPNKDTISILDNIKSRLSKVEYKIKSRNDYYSLNKYINQEIADCQKKQLSNISDISQVKKFLTKK